MKFSHLIPICLLFFVACNSENSPGSAPDVTENATQIGNFKYRHLVKNDGPTPKPGQLIQYNFRMWQGEKVVSETPAGSIESAFFPTDEQAAKDPQALIEGLRLMAEGDSLTIIFPFSSEKDGFYTYAIKMRKIFQEPITRPQPPAASQVDVAK
jgi:hypothetical protein